MDDPKWTAAIYLNRPQFCVKRQALPQLGMAAINVERWAGNVAFHSNPPLTFPPIVQTAPTPNAHTLPYPSSIPPSTTASIPDSNVGDLPDFWLEQTVEDAYERYGLPSVLHSLDDVNRMGIAYACEARNVVQDEANIAERRYRQILFIAKIYHAHFLRAQEKLQHLQRRLDEVIDVGVKEASSPGRYNQQSPEGEKFI